MMRPEHICSRNLTDGETLLYSDDRFLRASTLRPQPTSQNCSKPQPLRKPILSRKRDQRPFRFWDRSRVSPELIEPSAMIQGKSQVMWMRQFLGLDYSFAGPLACLVWIDRKS